MSITIGTMNAAALAPALLSLLAGVAAAILYGRRRKWPDAWLVLLAGVSLAVALADLRLPSAQAPALPLTVGPNGTAAEADLLAVRQAGAIALSGDGLREAQWRDLPALPLQWKPADADLLWLDFPRAMSLGRIFTLTVRRAPGQSQARAGWRLQLLAENQQVLADSGAATAATQLSVEWLPPVAERMVLQARLLDAAGKIIAQGPIPLQVQDTLPLQIIGRFDAPSFDAKTLNQLLTDGGAILDWSVTLGKAMARSETAREALSAPNATLVDAAHVERLAPAARAALLAQAGQGVPLVILGGNAGDAALWQRELGLRLLAQSPTTEKEDQRQFSMAGVALPLPPASLNPADDASGAWSVLARDDKRMPWLWQRELRQGRVIWIGVSDWHRYAISEPRALALWWQAALDRIALASVRKAGWRMPDPLPVPGLRSEICAYGVKAGSALEVDGTTVQMMARADKADAVCGAVWPRNAGWQTARVAAIGEPGMQYVYAESDWPAWQKALRREATAQYAARALPAPDKAATGATRPLPVTPFALLFLLSMLGLWWREQRLPAG